MFAHLNPDSSDFGDVCALHAPFLHQPTMQSSLFEAGRPVLVVLCVARNLRPCPSYSRRGDRIHLGLWRSLYKGGAGYFFPDFFKCGRAGSFLQIGYSPGLMWHSGSLTLQVPVGLQVLSVGHCMLRFHRILCLLTDHHQSYGRAWGCNAPVVPSNFVYSWMGVVAGMPLILPGEQETMSFLSSGA